MGARIKIRRGLPALALILASCEAIVPYHRDSAETIGERVAVVLEPRQAAGEDAPVLHALLPRDGARSSVALDPLLVEERIEKLLARATSASARKPSRWSGRTAGEFYAEAPRRIEVPPGELRGALVELRPGIVGFRVERWLGEERAACLEFSLEPRDDAFRVVLDRISMRYSRAKVGDESWWNWWSRVPCLYGFAFDVAALFGASYGDGAVDVQVDVAFDASWTDADGEARYAPIAVLGWTVLDVPLGGEAFDVGQSSGWLPLVPPSVRTGGEPMDVTLGRGRFSVLVSVTEQDTLTPQSIAERDSVGRYFDQVLGIVTSPVPAP